MTVYATRLVNGTDSMERMRRTDALGLFPSGPGTARGGFRNDGGGVVTVNAGTMTVSVTPFMAYVDGGVSDVQGGYTFVSDGTETLTVSPGHASLTRTDVVIAEVRDTTHDGSGSTDARVRILEGAPGSGVPALPTNALALRNITVPAGLSAGTGGLASGNLSTDRRTYTTGLGGVLTVGSQAERDALPAVVGTEVYRTDVDRLQVRTSNGWRDVAQGGDWQDWTPTFSGGAAGTFSVRMARYTLIGRTCHFTFRLQVTGSGNSDAYYVSTPLPANPNIPGWLPIGMGVASTVNGFGYGDPMCLRSVSTVHFVPRAAAAWKNTIPFTWATGDSIEAAGTYEIA